MRQFSHDPFGRFSSYRKTINRPSGTCAECGYVRRRKNGTTYLYQYGTVKDDSLRNEFHTDGKLFCSVGCARLYHT